MQACKFDEAFCPEMLGVKLLGDLHLRLFQLVFCYEEKRLIWMFLSHIHPLHAECISVPHTGFRTLFTGDQ